MSAVLSRFARHGNSTGLTFTRELLEKAGFDRGDQVAIEAVEGRIVITPAKSSYARAMAAFGRSTGRYGRTYSILAR